MQLMNRYIELKVSQQWCVHICYFKGLCHPWAKHKHNYTIVLYWMFEATSQQRLDLRQNVLNIHYNIFTHSLNTWQIIFLDAIASLALGHDCRSVLNCENINKASLKRSFEYFIRKGSWGKIMGKDHWKRSWEKIIGKDHRKRSLKRSLTRPLTKMTQTSS